MRTRAGTTRTFTISFPPDLADQVERLAARESRTTSELFREAFRTDRAVQILGGHGYIRENLVEMWMRNGRGFAMLTGLAIV